MPISKRTLTKWRKEGLRFTDYEKTHPVQRVLHKRILLLTQELLDQHLLKEK